MLQTMVNRTRLRNAIFLALPVSVGLLMAGDTTWRDKSVSGWTNADIQQVLLNSPWSRIVSAGITRRQSEDELEIGRKNGATDRAWLRRCRGPKTQATLAYKRRCGSGETQPLCGAAHGIS